MKVQPIGSLDRNWPEGDYLCSCVDCKLPFTGHKRQHTCRKCQGEAETVKLGHLLEEIRARLESLRHRYQSTIDHTGLPPAASENPLYWQGMAAAMDDDAREILDLLGTPPPTVWHRASEKLPTEADGDYAGSVWVLSDGEIFREPLASVRVRVREGECVSWTPTNFTKPTPPTITP